MTLKPPDKEWFETQVIKKLEITNQGEPNNNLINTLKDKIVLINPHANKSIKIELLNAMTQDISRLNNLDKKSILIYACESLKLSSTDVSEVKKEVFKVKRTNPTELRWDISETGELKKTFANTKNFLLQSGLNKIIKYNEFSNDIEINGKLPWEEKDSECQLFDETMSIKFREYFSETFRFDVNRETINEVIFAIAYSNKFHPIKEYLENIYWDKVSRLETWMIDMLGAIDDLYTRAVSQKVLVAAVKRIYEPGCEFHHILILEGLQGLGKTTTLKILAGQWYGSVNIDTAHKDLINNLRGVWINEIGEMSGMQKKEVSELKKFITDNVDRVRMPYARVTEKFPRKWILIGTMNKSGSNTYLKDDTGNRRFWPIECNNKSVDFIKLRELRDQLWAEAVYLYYKGESVYLDNEEIKSIHKDKTDQRTQEDEVLKDQILEFMNAIYNKGIRSGKPGHHAIKFTMKDLFKHLNLLESFTGRRGIESSIGVIIFKLGFTKHRNRDGYFYWGMMDGGSR